MEKHTLLVFLMLFVLPSGMAATLSGTLYDIGLEPIKSGIVSLGPSSEQRFVVKDGTYTFTVPEGEYIISASTSIENETWFTKDSISITQDGVYVLDLILEPSFATEEDLSFDETLDVLDEQAEYTLWIVLLGIIVIISVGIFYTRMMAVKAPEHVVEDEFRKAVLDCLQKHKGRVTQRELRKEMPFSEAKVSLVLTELEAEGHIKRIKKGRGNIIVQT